MPRTPPRVEIKETGPKVSRPTIVVGVPEVGLVGTIACSFIVEQLKMEPRGYIDSDLVPQVMVVHNAIPTYPIHIFGKGSILVVLSEVPLTGRLSVELGRELARWAKARGAKMVIGVAGIPSRKREDSQGEGKSEVLGVSNDQRVLEKLKPLGAVAFDEGIISGFYAGLVKQCGIVGQANVTLLGESLLQFPDPGAAASVIEVLKGMLSIDIDVQALLKESEEVRMRTRELMQQTQQAAAQAQAPIGSPTVYR